MTKDSDLTAFIAQLGGNFAGLWQVWLFFALCILVAAAVFHLKEKDAQEKAENEKNPNSQFKFSRWLSLYVVLVTFTTVGYGDYTPKTLGGRLIAICTALVGIVCVGVVVSVLYSSLEGHFLPKETRPSSISSPSETPSETPNPIYTVPEALHSRASESRNGKRKGHVKAPKTSTTP